MLDFQAVRDKEITITELTADITRNNLRDLTNEMIDTMLDLIVDCEDEDVVFKPVDPDAHDSYAENTGDVDLAWNLGHLIVHVTASAEEAAALATELARGVEFHGRSRYETPWETVTTITQCRHRLEESRRMRLASLVMWPDRPHLDNISKSFAGEVNAIGQFALGLYHDSSHLDQITEVVRQAHTAQG